MAGKDSGIRTPQDLKGKRLGAQTGSQSLTVFLSKMVPAFGLKEGDFQVVNTRFPDQLSALASKGVDAIVSDDPRPALAEENGIGYIVVNLYTYDPLPVLLMARTDLLEAQSEAVVRFLRVWLDSLPAFTKDLPGVARALQQALRRRGTEMPLPLIQTVLGRLVIAPDLTPALRAYLDDLAKIMRDRREIRSIPDWSRALRRDVLQKARAR